MNAGQAAQHLQGNHVQHCSDENPTSWSPGQPSNLLVTNSGLKAAGQDGWQPSY
jgi:hypothetical protein